MKRKINPIITSGLSLAEWQRFWSSVEKSQKCWNWNGVRHHTGGYGMLRWRGKKVQAHRLSYQITCGKIEPDFCVLHRCDNPVCVRPDHLFLGNHNDNMQDRMAKGRYRAKSHCNHGHELTGSNLRVRPIKSWNGKIYPCRICVLCSRKNSTRGKAKRDSLLDSRV